MRLFLLLSVNASLENDENQGKHREPSLDVGEGQGKHHSNIKNDVKPENGDKE